MPEDPFSWEHEKRHDVELKYLSAEKCLFIGGVTELVSRRCLLWALSRAAAILPHAHYCHRARQLCVLEHLMTCSSKYPEVFIII